MAIGTPVSFGTTTAIDDTADVVLTLSGTLTADRLSFAVINITTDSLTTVAPTSVTGGGVTWALETGYAYDAAGGTRGGIYVYRGTTATPSGTTVTFAVGYAYEAVTCGVFQVPGATLSNNGADAIAQEVTNVAASAGTVAAAMVTAGSADNGFVVFGGYCNDTGTRTFVADAAPAMTILAQASIGNGAANRQSGVMLEYVLGNTDTNPSLSYTFSSGVANSVAVVSYEVAAASGPTIDTEPVSDLSAVNPSLAAVFTVEATTSGTDAAAQWYRGASGVTTNPINSGGVYAVSTTGTVSLVSTLTITVTDDSLDAETYWCAVTDDSGTTDSTAATLAARLGVVEVAPDPNITNASGQTGAVTLGTVATDMLLADWPEGSVPYLVRVAQGVEIQAPVIGVTP